MQMQGRPPSDTPETQMHFLIGPRMRLIETRMQVHKSAEKFKSQLISPGEIRKAIQQMEEDKNMLEQKVEALHMKLQSTDHFDQMLEACSKLRVEQDEQLKLQDRLKEQKSHFHQAEHRLGQLKQLLSEKRASESADTDILRLMNKLEVEVHTLGQKAHQELPQEIGRKQQRMDELRHILEQPMAGEAELREMHAHRQQLVRAVGALEDRKRQMLSDPDDKLAMFRQQANLVNKKREQVHARLEMLLRERADMDAELASKAKELDGVGKGAPVLKGEEFRKYASDLRAKTAQYKRMKAELSELSSEWGILARTEKILREQEAVISMQLGEVESRQKAKGHFETQEKLNQVSQHKAEVDSVKGKTLEEISQVVEEINGQIKENKNRLAPQIKGLRTLRTEYQELESEYLEKKAVYDNQKAGLDSEIAKMEAEQADAHKELQHEESNCHYYDGLGYIERVKMERAQRERKGDSLHRSNPDGSVVRSYKELYLSKIKDQERQTKELRERQKAIKDHHGPNKTQMNLFRDLHKLLRCKMDMQQRARAEANSLAAAEDQPTNILTVEESPTGAADVFQHM
uniref:Intraflagellar transport protein 81 homolog n=1 Tax=Calcidiscus leptoporus TaxID=127549 RepID=A0A7S0JK75_9EUKA|mmetsp:Transcript_6738/g.15660  ORF Transcript_6738/g.15660 Transcript_6738/m.15660 type:complete len:575 (+) Transcript_6738:313-2037(+)|eukprot:CAMPEP_0119392522 /NCGR_PEP_ID=MMETSP1334-20130426/121518_1 /TAXON_ID=127549 /ORGANISM="Calcidiscus leptoporus, Strain RCC1130" /LENGTH=574 /DNA_ID=CAMNT_0007415387 /DNA_START=280 /DNA_END=2004 /DNA_ORIENTATION=-